MKQILFWSPRVLGILMALFLSLFALDVFGEGTGFGETLMALLIHLVPVYIVIILLLIAWRWERFGATLFIALALFYVLQTGRWDWGLIIAGPLVLIGVLFLLNGVFKAT